MTILRGKASMKYKICPGIIHESICGEELLLATAEARGKAPMVRWLNESSVYLWRLIENGESESEIIAHVVKDYGIKHDEASVITKSFLAELCKAGYLEFAEETNGERRPDDRYSAFGIVGKDGSDSQNG